MSPFFKVKGLWATHRDDILAQYVAGNPGRRRDYGGATTRSNRAMRGNRKALIWRAIHCSFRASGSD
jgi:hypothetical protein